MNGFKNIYNENDINNARGRLRKSLCIFCAVAAVFAAFCAVFVVLYVKCELSVYLCFALNFIATAAFVWYAVIYFKCVYVQNKNLLAFYRLFENADLKPLRGVYAGVEGEVIEKKVAFGTLKFSAFDGETEILVKSGVRLPFAEGKAYDLLVAGNKIYAYKGAEND